MELKGESRIALDTSAYAWLRSGHAEVVHAIAAADVVWVPTIVVGELLGGFELGTRQSENVVTLEEFLGESFVAVKPVTYPISRLYGRIYAQLRRAGTPIPINDVWIAATAMDCGARLVTFDRHFERIVGLDVHLISS